MKTSAYKDPVKIQNMTMISDKIITGFFVVVFGILWYLSTKSYVKPENYTIVIYDLFGKEVKMTEIRTQFSTINVARSYLTEYQQRFPHLSFTLAVIMPQMKNNRISNIFQINHK